MHISKRMEKAIDELEFGYINENDEFIPINSAEGCELTIEKLIDSIAFDSSMTAAGIEITNGAITKNIIIKTIITRPLKSSKFVSTPKRKRIIVNGTKVRAAITRPIPIKFKPWFLT